MNHASIASVIIPAHNEELRIGRTLESITKPIAGGLDILVVCNGCIDATAEIASGYGVEIIEISESSKYLAMRAGDRASSIFPRVYLDADVEISAESLTMLIAAVDEPGIEAAGPRRIFAMEGANRAVRWYYDVWEMLPQVRYGLFGRGVMTFSMKGHKRIAHLPPFMSDDLVLSESIPATARSIVQQATVLIRPPRTINDLMRRRVRVSTGNIQADEAGVRTKEARTSMRILLELVRSDVRWLPKVAIFVGIALLARCRAYRAARAGDFTTWLRDESSRAG